MKSLLLKKFGKDQERVQWRLMNVITYNNVIIQLNDLS